MFPFNFPTQFIETLSCSVCTRKRATTQDVLSVEACQNVTPRPRQGFCIVDAPYLVVVNSCVVITFKIGQKFRSSSFARFISFMKKHSTSLKVTFDPSLLCRHSCRRCFFSFRTTFSYVFLPTFSCILSPGLAGRYHVFWTLSICFV